jgi:hypothetical protein
MTTETTAILTSMNQRKNRRAIRHHPDCDLPN